MRVFLCAFGDFSVAIPMDSISSLTLYTGDSENIKAVVFNQETASFYVSLFYVFNLQPEKTRHGIVLKNDFFGNNIILLSSPVKNEIEIPNERIFPLPNILNGTDFSSFFNGIQFNHDKNCNPILILNTDKIIQQIQKQRGSYD